MAAEKEKKRRRPTIVSQPEYDVGCLGCEWQYDKANGLAMAALHHDKTGHTVVIRKSQTITYGKL